MEQKGIGKIDIVNHYPIALKRHNIRSDDNRNLGLILIIRNFNECVVNYLNLYSTNSINWEELNEHIERYMALIDSYENWNNNKILMYYEDLIENYGNEIMRLLKFCNLFNENDFKQFVCNYDNHKSKSIAYIKQKTTVNTEGKITNYYNNETLRAKARSFYPLA